MDTKITQQQMSVSDIDQNLQIELIEKKEIAIGPTKMERVVSTSVDSPREGIYSNMMKLMKEKDDDDNKRLDGRKYFDLFKMFVLYVFWFTTRETFIKNSSQKFAYLRIYSYRAQTRLIHLWIISLLILLFSNIDKVNMSSGIIISIIFFILMILFCIIIFIVCLVADSGSGLERINIIFGIPSHNNDDNITKSFTLNRNYYGLIFLISVFLASVVNLLIYSIFRISSSEIDDCEDNEILLNDVAFASKCAVNQSSISQVYVFVLVLAITFLSYYVIRPEFICAMNSYLDNNNDILTDSISSLNIKIENELDIKWRESHRWYNRIAEMILTYIILFIFHLITYGILRNNIFSGNISTNSKIFCIFIYSIDALLISMCSYFILIDMLYHYTFPSYILDLLSLQFNSTHINDIISWWHLRNYYLDCVIDIFASSIRGAMGGALIGCTILISFGFGWTSADKSVTFVFWFYTVIVISLALIIAKLAADIDTKQISHIHTLNREYLKLNLDIIQTVAVDPHDNDKKQYDNIINLISKDIKENNKPMRVFGIAMNSQFLIALRASAFAVIMAYLFSKN